MPDTTEWDNKSGPRIGDYCVLETGEFRIGDVLADGGVKLADDPTGFLLLDGDVGFSGGLQSDPPIPSLSLEMQPETRRGPVKILSDFSSEPMHARVSCRVFKRG